MISKLHNFLHSNVRWYKTWHRFKYHHHIHWGIFGTYSLLTTLKILALILSISIVSYPLTTYASTQTWTLQSDWGNWTKSQTTNTISSGSLTLNAASSSWSSESDLHVGSSANQNILTASFYSDNLRRFYIPSAPYLYEINWEGSSWNFVATNSLGSNDIPNIGGTPRIIGNAIYYVGQSSGCTAGSPLQLIKLTPGTDPGDPFSISYIDYVHGTSNGESVCSFLDTPPIGGPDGSIILFVRTQIDWQPDRNYIVEYSGSSWTQIHSSNPGWSYTGLGYGNGRGDAVDRLYFGAGSDGLYEMTKSGTWSAPSLISGSESPDDKGNTIIFGTVGDNTTDTRMYAVGNNVYQYNYSGDSWTVTDIGDGSAYGNSIVLGDGRGDGVNRLYFNTSIVDGEQSKEASLSDDTWTLANSGLGGGRNGGGEGFGGLWMGFAGDSRNDGSGSVIAGDFYETKYSVSTYNTPGYASINFDGTNPYSEWQALTKSETTNGQTIAYYTKTSANTSCTGAGTPWTGWSVLSFSGNDADLTGFQHTRYLCLGVNLSTADTAVTPQVDALTLTYVDDTNPTAEISSPTSETTYITNTTPVVVSGASADTVGTVATTTSSSGASNTGTATSWSFSETLVEGSNALTYTATDDVGQTGTDAITITYDPNDPTVAITSGTTSTTALYTISGTSADTGGTGVASVSISGAADGNGTATGTESWSKEVTLAEGINSLTVTSTDNATNTSTDTISVVYTAPSDPEDPPVDPPDDPDTTAPNVPIDPNADCLDDGAMDLSWTKSTSSDTNGYLIVRYLDTDTQTTPTTGTTYTAGNTLGVGKIIAVTNSATATANDSDISYDTYYVYIIYAFDGSKNYSTGAEVTKLNCIKNHAPGIEPISP